MLGMVHKKTCIAPPGEILEGSIGRKRDFAACVNGLSYVFVFSSDIGFALVELF